MDIKRVSYGLSGWNSINFDFRSVVLIKFLYVWYIWTALVDGTKDANATHTDFPYSTAYNREVCLESNISAFHVAPLLEAVVKYITLGFSADPIVGLVLAPNHKRAIWALSITFIVRIVSNVDFNALKVILLRFLIDWQIFVVMVRHQKHGVDELCALQIDGYPDFAWRYSSIISFVARLPTCRVTIFRYYCPISISTRALTKLLNQVVRWISARCRWSWYCGCASPDILKEIWNLVKAYFHYAIEAATSCVSICLTRAPDSYDITFARL